MPKARKNKVKMVDPITGEASNSKNAIPKHTFYNRRMVDYKTGKPSNESTAIPYYQYIALTQVDPVTGEKSDAVNAITYRQFYSRRKVDPLTGKSSNEKNAISSSEHKRLQVRKRHAKIIQAEKLRQESQSENLSHRVSQSNSSNGQYLDDIFLTNEEVEKIVNNNNSLGSNSPKTSVSSSIADDFLTPQEVADIVAVENNRMNNINFNTHPALSSYAIKIKVQSIMAAQPYIRRQKQSASSFFQPVMLALEELNEVENRLTTRK